MNEINLLDKNFTKVGTINTQVNLSKEMINTNVVHQVVVSLLANRRQGTASTKTKGFVSGGGHKPFKQKGTGRARQGSNRSPLMVGGGTVFGPQPRDYSRKVNKKTMNVAIQSVLADKLNAGKLLILDKIVSNGKTKEMFTSLKEKNLESALVVCATTEHLAIRACKNLKRAKGVAVKGFSVYEALKYENLIMDKASYEALSERLG